MSIDNKVDNLENKINDLIEFNFNNMDRLESKIDNFWILLFGK